MIFGFFFKLALATIGCGTLVAVIGKNTREKDMFMTGLCIACVGVFVAFFAVGQDDDQTKDIKAGLCFAKETEMYQPPSTRKNMNGDDIIPEAFLRTRYECPATEFYRAPQ